MEANMSSAVLIAEDEGIVAMEIKECLEGLGHTVSGVADTGIAAVNMAAAADPDLVLMDIRLKGEMDGIEAAAKIRKRRDVPIIYLTAYSGDTMLERAKLTEPYGYLLKPVQNESLESAIRIALHKHRRDAERRSDLNSLSALVGSLQSGIVVTDSELTVRYINAVAGSLLGIAPEKAEDRPLTEVVRFQDLVSEVAAEEPANNALTQGKTTSLDNQLLVVPQSGGISADLVFAPMRRGGDEVTGVMVTLSDARKRM